MKQEPVRSRFQIDASKATRDYAKALAYKQGLSLTEFVLLAMAEVGDAKLKELIKDEVGTEKKLEKEKN